MKLLHVPYPRVNVRSDAVTGEIEAGEDPEVEAVADEAGAERVSVCHVAAFLSERAAELREEASAP